MWTFRAMVDNAEAMVPDIIDLNEHDGLLFKVADDPRITRVGKVLRRLSLDVIDSVQRRVLPPWQSRTSQWPKQWDMDMASRAHSPRHADSAALALAAEP